MLKLKDREEMGGQWARCDRKIGLDPLVRVREEMGGRWARCDRKTGLDPLVGLEGREKKEKGNRLGQENRA